MSLRYPAATFRAAMILFEGRNKDITELLQVDKAEAQEMALGYVREMINGTKVLQSELLHFAEQLESSLPFDLDEDAEVLEAEIVEHAHVHPHFAPLLDSVRRLA